MPGTARDELMRRVAVARGDEPADLVLAGGRVLSVFTGELLDADVAICGDRIAGIGPYAGRGKDVVDVTGLILLPGFIDGHMHLESTKLMVDRFAGAVLRWGTTTAVIDPHEIANVFGLDGVSALLACAAGVPFDLAVMVPSCVPASPFESNGATVDADDIARFLEREPRRRWRRSSPPAAGGWTATRRRSAGPGSTRTSPPGCRATTSARPTRRRSRSAASACGS
jgi:adenine deaminase